MATRSMSSDPWANAAANIGEALFPSARTVAQGKIAGQTLSELVARTRKGTAEAAGLEDQNSALADAVLEQAGLNPMQRALIRAGRGNAQQLAAGAQTVQQMGGDQSAADAFATGDFTGASAGRLRGGRDPLAVNKIEGGYQLNPYQQGGEITATGETLADILAANALVEQREAAAGFDRERTANPERFRAAPASKTSEITPSEAKALDDLIGNYLPSVGAGKDAIPAEIDPALRNAVLTRASELLRQGGDAQAAVNQAFGELVEQTQAGAPAVAEQDNFDLLTALGIGSEDVEAAPAKPHKFAPKKGAAKPAAAARDINTDPNAISIRDALRRGEITRGAAAAALQKLGY